MGKIAFYTCAAFTMQEFLANRNLVRIVDIQTRRSFVAGAYTSISIDIIKPTKTKAKKRKKQKSKIRERGTRRSKSLAKFIFLLDRRWFSVYIVSP